MLRVIKNRFGSNAELAVLDMGARGMEEVANPSALFLSTAGARVCARGSGARGGDGELCCVIACRDL